MFLFEDFSLGRMYSCYRNCQLHYPSFPSSYLPTSQKLVIIQSQRTTDRTSRRLSLSEP